MLKRLLTAVAGLALWCGAAEIAHAYPTSIWNVPTGTVADAGTLHVGIYTYASLERNVSIQDGLTFGALPGLELGGVPGIGAMELGVDTYGSYEAFNGKLQLVGETLYTPAVAVGGLNVGNTMGPSENVVYGAVTKEVGPEDMSGGSWTIGYFTTMSDDPEAVQQSGLMGGISFKITDTFNVAFDFLMGTTSVSGGNLLMNYSVSDNAVVSAGYYIHPSDSTQNLIFIGADLDIPTGLFGQSSAGQED